MAGGPRSRKTEWGAIVGAIGIAFQLLFIIIGALMGYAYLNGATAQRIDALERQIVVLQRGRR